MSSQVVRVQSFGKGSLGGIGKEVERNERDSLESRNIDIDKNRTHLNEFYKHTEHGMYAEFKKITKELNISNADNLKKNAVAFEGLIITSDKEFFDKLGYVRGEEPPQKVREFFNEAYEFAKKEIGFRETDKNILCASVHYDETTPHLQLYYIPVVDAWKEKVYEKDENGKVKKNSNGSPIQARDINGKILYNDINNSKEPRVNRTQFWQNKGGKTSYTQMQDRFYEQLSKKYGLGRGEKGSTREHLTKAQWEQKEVDKNLSNKYKELESCEKKIDRLKGELEYAEDGNVLVPMLVAKSKTSDIQNQNSALKIELSRLQKENSELKKENDNVKQELNVYTDALKDRNSELRMALDTFDIHVVSKAYMDKARSKIKGLDYVLNPLEQIIDKVQEYGSKMLQHKKGYVECSEKRKSIQIDIESVQVYKNILMNKFDEIRAIDELLRAYRDKLKLLEKEKNEISKINPKQITLNKQMKECMSEIKMNEELLMNKFDMHTDESAIIEEMRWYEREISKSINDINDKSNLVDDLSNELQEHLKGYRRMKQIKSFLDKPIQRIVNRYDNEYEVPTEYYSKLHGFDIRGLSEEHAKAYAMCDWKELIDETSRINNVSTSENVVRNEQLHHHTR